MATWPTLPGSSSMPSKDGKMLQDSVTGEIVGFKPMVIWDGIERRNAANDRIEKLSQFHRRFNDVKPK